MIEIALNDKISLLLPENWSEVIHAGKMIAVVETLLLKEDIATNKLRMLTVLCPALNGYTMGKLSNAGNSKKRAKLADGMSNFLSAQIIDLLFPCLDYIYSAEQFYEHPLPKITIDGTDYISLENKLINQTGDQWSIAYHAQSMYSQTENEAHLRALMASSYLRLHDGMAVPFSEQELELTLKAFGSLSSAELQAFYMWYIHADKWWMDKFPWIFPAPDDEDAPSTAPNNGLNIRNMVYELSGGKPTADWDVVKKRTRQDIIFALDRLEDKRIEMERSASSD